MQEEQIRQLPASEIDLSLMLTDSVWGKSEVPSELKEKLSKYKIKQNPDGTWEVIDKISLWGSLGFYTRDLRLANLDAMQSADCIHYLNLAKDFSGGDNIEPFLTCLSRIASIIEISQSSKGFLRRQMNTLRQEHVQQTIEPPKKGFFGGSQNKNNGGGFQ